MAVYGGYLLVTNRQEENSETKSKTNELGVDDEVSKESRPTFSSEAVSFTVSQLPFFVSDISAVRQ